MPETLSQNALRQLRAGSTSQEIINRCKAGDPLIEMSVFPEIRLRYEFPYKPNMPASYLHDNPYLDSIIYEATSLYLSPERPTPDTTSGIVPEKYYGLYTKPFHAGKVIEPRLADAKPSAWTSICSDDVLMRDLLSVFLRCEYQMTAAFQKDLFLEDMASMQHDFCSSLLVNAVLAYACVSHATGEHNLTVQILILSSHVIRSSRTEKNTGTPTRTRIGSLRKPGVCGNWKPTSHD